MPSLKHLAAAAASTLRCRLSPSLRIRRGGGRGRSCTSRCTNQVHEERPKGFAFSRTPPPPTPAPAPAPAPSEGQKWEDWELPCYITSFLAVVILGVGFSAKPDDVRIESWAHGRTLERLELESKGR